MKFILDSDFKRSVASQLVFDELATVENNTLFIDSHNIYKLEARQLAYLDAPDFFLGFMTVKFKSAPRPFHCELSFKDEFQKSIKEFEIDECFIKYQGKRYILPKEMFDIYQMNTEQTDNGDEDLLYHILEKAKNSTNDNIMLEGLQKEDIINSLPSLHIDVQMNTDGTATIMPFLPNIDEKRQKEYEEQILNSDYIKMLVEVHNHDRKRHRIRHIMHPKDVEAYKRLHQIGVIKKEDVAKFVQNPAPFILLDDESQDDLPIYFESYRILGMGEPYVGYFGSKSLDSPIAKALLGAGDMQMAKEVKNKIKDICNERTLEEIKEFQEQIQKAIIESHTECIIDEEFFPKESFGTVLTTLNSLIKKAEEQRLDSPTKIVISIDPNDELDIFIPNQNKKQISQINTKNNDKGETYRNFKPNFEPKSYQIQGVNWLIDLYQNQFRGGILADDMGLGKTFQVIAFVNYLLHIDENFKGKRILIVAPTVLLDNWKKEFEKFFKENIYENLNIHIVRGRDLAKRRQVNKNEQGVYNSFDVESFLQRPLDILITSYETLSNYQYSFVQKLFNWGCVIYDEAHKIKNPNAQISQASRAISSEVDFSVLLTGTPIENELRDLWALFDVFDPQHFGSWKNFRKHYVDKQNDISQVEHRLREHASNYLLRRLKKDYLKELPSKIEQVHEVVFNNNESEHYIECLNSNEIALTRLHKLKSFSLSGILDDTKLMNDFSKTNELISLLESIKKNNEKAIIFIIQRAVQDLIKFGIEQTFGIDVSVINGDNNSSDKVQVVLDKFNQTTGFGVIILSPLSAGVGLTITSANHVIHYERWWNASKEDQASDRAYRIGQQKDVYIHYILGELPKHQMNKIAENRQDETKEFYSIDRAIHQLISQKRETAGFLIPPKNITMEEVCEATMKVSSKEVLMEQLKELSWQNFEYLIKKLYEKQGYQCQLTPIGQQDFGADIIAKKDDEVIAIQCKHSKNGKNRNDDAVIALINQAQEVYGANKLVAVTNSGFHFEAKRLTKENSIELVECGKLIDLILNFDIMLPHELFADF